MRLSRLLDAHQVIIRQTHKLARRASELGDDGTNDLLVSEVMRTNEIQVWVPKRAFGLTCRLSSQNMREPAALSTLVHDPDQPEK